MKINWTNILLAVLVAQSAVVNYILAHIALDLHLLVSHL